MPAVRRATIATVVAVAAFTTAVAPAQADHFDRLLAPHKVCRGQLNTSNPTWKQERTMRCLHAYARRKAGRPRFRRMRTRRLERSAHRKAVDVLRCQSFSHTACGRDAFYWLRRNGFLRRCSSAAENLALGSRWRGSTRAAMSGWLHSRGHRRALLARRYTLFGVGMVRGSYRGYSNVQFWVAHFGRC